jgi:hypothetical protein
MEMEMEMEMLNTQLTGCQFLSWHGSLTPKLKSTYRRDNIKSKSNFEYH